MYTSLLLLAVLAAENAPVPEAAPPLVVPAELTAPIPVPPPPAPGTSQPAYRVLLNGQTIGEFHGPARLELPVGRYRVEWGGQSVDVELKGGPPILVDEVGLVLGTQSPLAPPAVEPVGWDLTLPGGRTRLQGALSVSYLTEQQAALKSSDQFGASGSVGLTDRLLLNVPFPALMYRFGGRELLEVSPWLGFSWFSFGSSYVDGTTFMYQLGVGTVVRKWTSDRDVLAFALDVGTAGMESEHSRVSPDDFTLHVALGYTRHFGTHVTLNLGAQLSTLFVQDGEAGFQTPVLSVGAAQSWGFVPAPLLQVHLSRRISLDASYACTVLPGRWTRHTFAGGTTVVF